MQLNCWRCEAVKLSAVSEFSGRPALVDRTNEPRSGFSPGRGVLSLVDSGWWLESLYSRTGSNLCAGENYTLYV